MHLNGSVAELARQGDDLGDDEFRDTARVGERRVEDGNTATSSIGEVDLVGADAEASNDEEVLGFAEDSLAQLGL